MRDLKEIYIISFYKQFSFLCKRNKIVSETIKSIATRVAEHSFKIVKDTIIMILNRNPIMIS